MRATSQTLAALCLLGLALGLTTTQPASAGERVVTRQSSIPKTATQQLEKARATRASGDYAEAITSLRAVVKDHPNYYDAIQNLGLAYYRKGDTRSALKQFRMALEVKEKEGLADTNIYNTLGWLYLESADYDNALKYLTLGTQNLENNDERVNRVIYNNLGLVYLNLGRLEEAEDAFQIAIQEYGNEGAIPNLNLVKKAKHQLKSQRSNAPEVVTREHIRWSVVEGGAQVWDGPTTLGGEALQQLLLAHQQEGSLGYNSLNTTSIDLIEQEMNELRRDWALEEHRARVEMALANWCRDESVGQGIQNAAPEARLHALRSGYARAFQGSDEPWLLNTMNDRDLARIFKVQCLVEGQ